MRYLLLGSIVAMNWEAKGQPRMALPLENKDFAAILRAAGSRSGRGVGGRRRQAVRKMGGWPWICFLDSVLVSR